MAKSLDNRVSSRVIDYSIYVGCGLLLSGLAYGPLFFGVDIRPLLPKIEAGAMAAVVVGAIGYELRQWLCEPGFWIYLGVISGLQMLAVRWLLQHGRGLSVIVWVLLGTLEVSALTTVFRVTQNKTPAPDSLGK